MAHKDVEREIGKLREEINRHNRLYYVEAAPVIGDGDFDRGKKIQLNAARTITAATSMSHDPLRFSSGGATFASRSGSSAIPRRAGWR